MELIPVLLFSVTCVAFVVFLLSDIFDDSNKDIPSYEYKMLMHSIDDNEDFLKEKQKFEDSRFEGVAEGEAKILFDDWLRAQKEKDLPYILQTGSMRVVRADLGRYTIYHEDTAKYLNTQFSDLVDAKLVIMKDSYGGL